MKKKSANHPSPKPKSRPFFLDAIFTNYRKYRNHKRYVHSDLL
jgi:hypothetical protein